MKRIIVMVAAALAVAFPLGASAQEEKFGLSIQGQIGVGQMVRDLETERDLVYGAILGLSFAGPLGLELDYQHAENDVKGFGAPTLKQDGFLGHVRFDFGKGTLIPFVYGGLGWVHYDVSSTLLDTTSDRLMIPLGAGLEFKAKPLIIGIRGEYQWATSEIAGEHTDYWKAVGTVGFRL